MNLTGFVQQPWAWGQPAQPQQHVSLDRFLSGGMTQWPQQAKHTNQRRIQAHEKKLGPKRAREKTLSPESHERWAPYILPKEGRKKNVVGKSQRSKLPHNEFHNQRPKQRSPKLRKSPEPWSTTHNGLDDVLGKKHFKNKAKPKTKTVRINPQATLAETWSKRNYDRSYAKANAVRINTDTNAQQRLYQGMQGTNMWQVKPQTTQQFPPTPFCWGNFWRDADGDVIMTDAEQIWPIQTPYRPRFQIRNYPRRMEICW